MSADNWAECPRCRRIHEDYITSRELEVEAAYGSVPVEEFDLLRSNLNADRAMSQEPTFREDYEIYGAEDGEVQVIYSGGCAKCGLSLKFNHSHPLDWRTS